MRRVSFPAFTAFSADAFWTSGGIFLSCQIIWTDWTCLASLPAWLLPTFTQHSRWHHQFPLDVPELFLLDNLRWILYTASASSFWMDRSLLRTQSYQRRGRLSPFLWF